MQNNRDNSRVTPGHPSAAASPSAGAVRATSYLGPSLHIKGEITGHEDLKIDSKVDGLISIGGFRITVGPQALLNADIVAREAVIAGEVVGDVSARDRIDVAKSASIVGNISAGKISIEEGAYFKGDLDVDCDHSQIGTDLDTLLRGVKNPSQE